MSDDPASILTSHNHELLKLVKARVDADYPMTFIAQELGVHVDELCEWVLRVYREPKPHKPKPYLNKGAGPIGKLQRSSTNSWSLTEQVRRQTAWQRQRDGARKALAE